MKPWDIKDYLIANNSETRTRKGKPCPKCGNDGGHCLVAENNIAALCPRNDGSGCEWGIRFGQYGYFFLFTTAFPKSTFPVRTREKKPKTTDTELDQKWRPRAKRWHDQGLEKIERLARTIGVSEDSLQELEAGWDGKAWTFPERNGTGLVIGVSRRFEDGGKRFAKGGRRGLTYSDGWRVRKGPVLIVEGQSDTAAGITLGLAAIGRPSNTGGLSHLTELLRDVDRKVIVIGERDQKEDGRWPGMEGCKKIALDLAKTLRRCVNAKLPPGASKDLREWLNKQEIDVDSEDECGRARKELLRLL